MRVAAEPAGGPASGPLALRSSDVDVHLREPRREGRGVAPPARRLYRGRLACDFGVLSCIRVHLACRRVCRPKNAFIRGETRSSGVLSGSPAVPSRLTGMLSRPPAVRSRFAGMLSRPPAVPSRFKGRAVASTRRAVAFCGRAVASTRRAVAFCGRVVASTRRAVAI